MKNGNFRTAGLSGWIIWPFLQGLSAITVVFNHIPECMVHRVFWFCSVLSKTGLSKYPGLKSTLLEMYSSGIDSPYLMSSLIDIYEEELKSGVADSNCLDQALEVGWYLQYIHFILSWMIKTGLKNVDSLRESGVGVGEW